MSTLIVTPGAVDANSYCLIETAAEYHASHPYGTAWFARPEVQAPALMLATRLLDQHCQWRGSRTFALQALGWPRQGVVYTDTSGSTADGYAYGSAGQLIPDTSIPFWLQQATAELARYLQAEDRTAGISTEQIDSFRIGPISMNLRQAGAHTSVLPASVQAFVLPYVTAGVGIVKRLVRA